MGLFCSLSFLFFAFLLGYKQAFPVVGAVFAWVGGIGLLNKIAPKIPFARSIHWVHAITFEIFAFLGVIVLRLVPMRQNSSKKGKPILLVHGYMNHPSVWFFFKKNLEALGFGPIYTIRLGFPFHSIRTYAEKIGLKAEQIAKETKRKDLVLIGHSMGGLVSLLYAAKIAASNTVTDVVTIASPLHGTPMAYLGIGPNAKEMRPNSALLKEIYEGFEKEKKVRLFHLATKSDQLVIPGESAIFLENKHYLFEDLGHASLLYSKQAARQVADWL